MKKQFSRWFDLSTAEGKLKLIIASSGTLLALLLVMMGALSYTSRPEFCSSCHKSVYPEYLTWSVSAHANAGCIECHLPPGLVNTLVHKAMALKEPAMYFTNTWEKPIKPTEPVENRNCQRCHSSNRNFTVSGDLIIPHDRHEKAGILCVDCHAGVAHAKIYERGLTSEDAPKKPEEWTAAYAETVYQKQFTNPDMDDCIKCHDKKGITVACEACHKTIYTPKDHLDKKSWLKNHGISAEGNVKPCQTCHNYGFSNTDMKLDNPAVSYAWNNAFCSECHAKMPEGHNNTTWRHEHKIAVTQKGEKNCEACHRLNSKYPEGAPAASTPCSKCHWDPKSASGASTPGNNTGG